MLGDGCYDSCYYSVLYSMDPRVTILELLSTIIHDHKFHMSLWKTIVAKYKSVWSFKDVRLMEMKEDADPHKVYLWWLWLLRLRSMTCLPQTFWFCEQHKL